MRKLFIILAVSCGLTASAQQLPYQNPNLSAKERAVDLCGRLGIKKFFWWSEALHGAANMGNVTNFPEPVAMASSFNPALLYHVA